MAIGKMKGDSPYIHSNVDYFKDEVSNNFTESIVVGFDEMNDTINSLIKISNQLKEEANDFLMGMGVQEVNVELLKLPNTYAGIAADIIQRPEIVNSLIKNFNINVVDIEKNIFKKGGKEENQIKKYILKEIGEVEQISASRLAGIIGQAFLGEGLGIGRKRFRSQVCRKC